MLRNVLPRVPVVALMAAFLVASSSAFIQPRHTALIAEARSVQQDDVEAQDFIRAASPAGIAPLTSGEVVVIAINGSDGSPSLLAYVGKPGDHPVQLPAGEWWLYALLADGNVRQTTSPLSGPTSISARGSWMFLVIQPRRRRPWPRWFTSPYRVSSSAWRR